MTNYLIESLLLIIFTFSTIDSFGQNVYYVQDNTYNANASDKNVGTDINYPWATWQNAFDNAEAGDTIYFRGGIWYPDSTKKTGYGIVRHDPQAGHGSNGEPGNPIVFLNYPGETPILDCYYASEVSTGNIGLGFNKPDHIVVKGLTIRNVRMRNPVHNCSGIEVTKAGYITFERMTVYGIGGVGYWVAGYDTLHLINCDVYECCDSLDLTVPGGDGDGYNISSGGLATDTFKIAYINGCRAWNCSDDGFDIGSTKQFIVSNCWSFHNGYQFPETGADGNGFKLAGSHVFGVDKRMVHHSLSAFNNIGNAAGFTAQNLTTGPSCSFYNNISYRDYMGFFTPIPIGWDCTSEPGFEIWKNNIVYNQIHYAFLINACKDPSLAKSQIIADHNSHTLDNYYPYSHRNPSYSITDDDFVLTDSARAMDELTAQRSTNGLLPNITFLNLVSTSDLIDRGIDVGLAYNGEAPDMGAFESTVGQETNNKFPFITIISPSNDSKLVKDNIIIIAEAIDLDGYINKVEFFYDDTIKIGESTIYPWTCSWNDAPYGRHFVRATATDNEGLKAISNRLYYTIIPENLVSEYFSIFPNPNKGRFTFLLLYPIVNRGEIKIFSLEGKLMYQDTIYNNEVVKQIYLPFIKSGVYIFMLTNNLINITSKFVVI